MKIQKLIKRGWIESTGKKVGRTKSVNEYKIIDLWKLNVDFYRKDKQAVNQVTSSVEAKVSPQLQEAVNQVYTEEEHIEEEYINNSEASEDAILEDLIKGTKSVTQEFQYLALEIIDILKVPQKDCASCFKVAKTFDKAQIMTSLSFARDYPNPELKWKMFLWKLHQLRKEGKNAKSGSDHGE